MQTQMEDEATAQLAEYLDEPNQEAAPRMVRTARNNPGTPVVTQCKDGGEVSVLYSGGWWKI